MDIDYTYCPDIWSGGREEIWYDRASESLVEEGADAAVPEIHP